MSRSGVVTGPDGTPQARWRGLGCADGFALHEVRCHNTDSRWRTARPSPTFAVQLSRSGGYLRRLNGRERFADATSAMFFGEADDIVAAHPLACGDTYTTIEIDAEVLADRPDAERWLNGAGWDGSVHDEIDLRHRTLVADCRRGIDRFELAERAHDLLAGLLATNGGAADDLASAVGRRPATLAAHRRLADRAREIIAGGGYTLGLADVARHLACSPHHLSRVFHRTTGQSLTAYRNRVRVRAVLTALDSGAPDSLRTLAATHGFADQPHLTRSLRQHLGRSPSQVRRLITASTSASAGGAVSTDVQRGPVS